MGIIVSSMKPIVANNEEKVKMFYFTNFQLSIYPFRKVIEIISLQLSFLLTLPQNVPTFFFPYTNN